MIFQIFLSLNLVLLHILCSDYSLFSEEFTSEIFTQNDVKGWSNNKGLSNTIYKCGDKLLFGGYKIFGSKTQVSKTYKDMPKHTKLKLQFTLYMIDTVDKQHNDYVKFIIDGQEKKSLTKPIYWQNGQRICGNSWGEYIYDQISIEMDHSLDSLKLEIIDTFNQNTADESWGIRDLKIYTDIVCTFSDSQLIGDKCFTKEKLITCSNSISNIKGNIQSNCTDLYDDGVYYKFSVKYQSPFSLNSDCFTQQVKVEDKFLQKGQSPYDQWTFDSASQLLTFQIKHQDLQSVYKCSQYESSNQIKWQCNFEVRFLLGGEVKQHTYKFHMLSTLDQKQTQISNLQIIPDEQQGECCINPLNINTTLNFCSDINCTNYHSLPYTAKRSDFIFIEHSITQSGFQYLYFHPSSITIFNVPVDILETNHANPGKIVYKTKAQLAFPDMKVEVISYVKNNPYSQNRFLQEQQSIGDNYGIKKTANISIVNDEDDKVQEKPQTVKQVVEKQNTTLVKVLVSICSLCATLGLGFFIYKIIQKYRINRSNKYQEPKQTTERQQQQSETQQE